VTSLGPDKTRRKGLPIVDEGAAAREAKLRDRRDGVALAAAQKLLDEGRVDEARATLVELVVEPLTPIRAHAALLAAGAALMAGDPSGALDVLARIPERPVFVIDEGYRRMIEACALRQARRYDDALVAAVRSVSHGPTPGRLLVLADAQKHAGHVEEAARTLEDLLARDPDNTTALAQLAGYKNLLGDVHEGARLLALFGERADESADALRNRAFVHATARDLDATVHALSCALALEPEATRSYMADEIELDRFRHEPSFRALVDGTRAAPR
jgi:tetratricopeptide (TPR) repeat protein